jgi:GMP synthase (glutamine-hydrolysing)
LIATEAQARGLHTDIRRLDLGAGVPQPDDVDGLVVMGGPMGVYETDKHPFLQEECNLISELVRRNRPVLGVCLGAQLLARALGARVFHAHGAEIGFGSVELTAEGKDDPLFGSHGPSLPVFHWHGDTFDLPPGATLLASSAEYRHQAFRFGSRAYGLQFHIEPDSVTWSAWYEHLPPISSERAEHRRYLIEQVGRSILARFFDVSRCSGVGIERRLEA